MPIQLNLANLNRAIASSFDATVDAIAQQSDTEIETSKWAWTGTTQRRNGQIVGSPRDIVDTGELLNSQQVTLYSDTEALIEYTADHASIVHRDRPFLETALEEADFAAIMAEELRDRLG